MLTVPHGFDDVGPAAGVEGIFEPQAVSAMTIPMADGATGTHLFRIRLHIPLWYPSARCRGDSSMWPDGQRQYRRQRAVSRPRSGGRVVCFPIWARRVAACVTRS